MGFAVTFLNKLRSSAAAFFDGFTLYPEVHSPQVLLSKDSSIDPLNLMKQNSTFLQYRGFEIGIAKNNTYLAMQGESWSKPDIILTNFVDLNRLQCMIDSIVEEKYADVY